MDFLQIEWIQAVGDFASQQLPNTLKFLFNHTVKTPIWIIGGLSLALGYNHVTQKRAIKKLLSGELRGKSAVISRTKYTDHEDGTFDQKIHTELSDVNLESIFGDELGKMMVKILDRAKKHVTAEKPSPFQHVDKVLPYKGINYNRFMGELSRRWQSRMSSILNDSDIYHERYEQHFLKLQKEGQLPPLGQPLPPVRVFPILVDEPYAHNKQYRILLLTESDIAEMNQRSKENIQTRRGGVVLDDISDNQRVRFDTNRVLAEALSSDEPHHVQTRSISRKEWWQMNFSVDHHMPQQVEIALRFKHGEMPDNVRRFDVG